MSNSATPEPGTERALRSSTRNPRRRPRQSDPDSLRTAPRRKRSKISENTFVPPRHDEEDEEEVNGTIEVAMVNSTTTTPSPKRGRGRPRKASAPLLDVAIPVRSKKNSIKRPSRGDGATVLTQTARYSVKLLPSTPKDLRREGAEFRGTLGAAHHALAVTREKAYVWDYTSHAPVNNPRVFDVPFAVKLIETLPFGALVATGASADIGLVLISATTGKVVFYESIERATSLGLFQERNVGVEGSLGTLFSGETVTDIVSAHQVGFIVTLSSGRIAQLTLRDAHGKAKVSAQFLRATEPSSSGLFGSIKGLLSSGGWKRDVTAVHTRQLGARGQVQVISLTERAEFQIWDLDWSGQYQFKSTLDFKEVIVRELKRLESPELQGKAENVTALDFSILEKSNSTNEVATLGAELPMDVLVLLNVGTPDDCEYVLASLVIEGNNVVVPQVLNLSTYRNHQARRTQAKPRLLLLKPAHTALVVFDNAIVLHAIDDSDANSPEAQLHASYIQPATFEDSVYLREGKGFTILGGFEEDSKGGQGSSIICVRGAGLVRISVLDPKSTEQEERISIKSKIEQAVFHGALQEGNILEFSRIGDSQYPPDDVEEAALAISDEILRSTSSFISPPTAMDTHLEYKAQALRALATYVRQNYPTLSKGTMWRLLWDAEKVAAAQQMWDVFEEHVSASSQTKAAATFLDEVCALEKGIIDGVSEGRAYNDLPFKFFAHHLHRIERLFPDACMVLDSLRTETDKSSITKIRLVLEADDLWNKTLGAVFAFRNDNAAAYGILPEFIEDGVLTDVAEYADLPEFWTSTEPMLKGVVKMAGLSRDIAREEWDKDENNPDVVPILKPMIANVNAQNPRLIQLLCLIYQERINWLASRTSEKDRELAEMLRVHYENQRFDQFRELAQIAQAEAGMRLAEKYKDMHTLTLIILGELQFSFDSLHEPGNTQQDRSTILTYIDSFIARIGRYFDRFGDAWANAYFDECFSGGRAGIMLRDAQENWQVPLTKYLRAEPSRAKLCWINDISANKDFIHAAECLITTASDQETKLWAKKVELSMGKLALLASREAQIVNDAAVVAKREFQDAIPEGEIEMASIQERLYRHMLPVVIHCIDHEAEVEVAMQKFGHKNEDLHALRQLLETYVDRLLDHLVLSGDELIDVLTLIDSFISEDVDGRNFQGQEYFFALKVLNAMASHIPQDRFETLLALIWKRCYVHDNWVEINSGTKRIGDETGEKLRNTAPWRTLYTAMDQGFFDSPGCYVRHLLPIECLGAGCQPEELSYRWSNQDLLDPILNDNRVHDEQLRSLVNDRRLDEWIEACVINAQSAIEENAEENAQRMVKEQEFEASVHSGEVNGGKANGHVSNGVIKIEDDGDDDESGVLDAVDVDLT